MSKTYLNRSDFDETKAQSTGGVTGSKAVTGKDGKTQYQLKPSIKQASFLRRFKAGGLDRENFGEVLAAEVSRALTNSDGELELVPKVALVYDDKAKQTLVASRYLENVFGGNLDEYAVKKRDVTLAARHVRVHDNGFAYAGELSLSGNNERSRFLRQDFAKAIAVSALSGDHDVNPGNMMVVKDKAGKARMARIDFGHAFNDLLNVPKIFGGGLRNKHNKVLDFINRETIGHFNSSQRTPKLWRDYAGLVPSDELVQSFKEIGGSKNLEQGMDKAIGYYADLVKDLSKNPKENKKPLDHIKKSLIAISNNVCDSKISSKLPVDEVLANVKKNLTEFYSTGQTQMLQVSELMDMQVKVDKLLQMHQKGESPKDLEKQIKATYARVEGFKGIGNGSGKPIEWVKNKKDTKAFKGTLQEFIKERAKALRMDSSIGAAAVSSIANSEKQVTFSAPNVTHVIHPAKEIKTSIPPKLIDEAQNIAKSKLSSPVTTKDSASPKKQSFLARIMRKSTAQKSR